MDKSMPLVLGFMALGKSHLLFASVLSSVNWVSGAQSLAVVMAGKPL